MNETDMCHGLTRKQLSSNAVCCVILNCWMPGMRQKLERKVLRSVEVKRCLTLFLLTAIFVYITHAGTDHVGSRDLLHCRNTSFGWCGRLNSDHLWHYWSTGTGIGCSWCSHSQAYCREMFLWWFGLWQDDNFSGVLVPCSNEFEFKLTNICTL